MDLVGIEFADLDELFDFDHANLATAGDHWIEVPRGFSKNQVAGLVALPRFHQGHLGCDARFKHIFHVVEILRLLAFSEFRAETGAGVKRRDTGAARPQSLGQCALRDQFEFELTPQHLTLEFLILANVRGHHLFHLSGAEQEPHAEIVHASIIADDGETLNSAVAQRRDEILRYAAEAKAAGGDHHIVVKQAIKRSLGVGKNFAHVGRSLTTD
jgi:hypothetical protein